MNPNTTKRTSSAAEILVSSDDLLIDIFLRLPVKSLIRFQSVSKRWKSLISDPQFRLARSCIPDPVTGIIIQRDGSAYVLPFDNSGLRQLKRTEDDSPLGYLRIFDSRKGLLLCYHLSDYYIWNPSTNQYSKLPELLGKGSVCWKYNTVRAMILAFDPSKSPHYKVVCVRWLGDGDDRNIFEVYSSETGSWKIFNKRLKPEVDFQNSVYWNGAIHWIAFTKKKKSIYFNPDDNDDQILTNVMPTPPPILDDFYGRQYRYFGESGGHLCYFHDRFGVNEFNVYEMRRDYSEWFVKYKVKTANLRMKDIISSYTLVWGNKDEDSFLVLSFGNLFVRFNFVHGTLETLHEFDGDCWIIGSHGLHYIESICSV